MDTPFSLSMVTACIRDRLAALMEAEQTIVPSWVVEFVMRHFADETPPGEFFVLCTTAYVRDEVRQQNRRFQPKPETQGTDDQIVMPGFEYLQRYYPTPRDGEEVLVPLTALSFVECQAKIAELRRMGDGCFRHARELEKYIAKRGAA